MSSTSFSVLSGPVGFIFPVLKVNVWTKYSGSVLVKFFY